MMGPLRLWRTAVSRTTARVTAASFHSASSPCTQCTKATVLGTWGRTRTRTRSRNTTTGKSVLKSSDLLKPPERADKRLFIFLNRALYGALGQVGSGAGPPWVEY